MSRKTAMIPFERIASVIHAIRGHKVILDSDLACMYGVPTKVLNQAVKRNLDKFPNDFRFQLTIDEISEYSRSRSQFATLKSEV